MSTYPDHYSAFRKTYKKRYQKFSKEFSKCHTAGPSRKGDWDEQDISEEENQQGLQSRPAKNPAISPSALDLSSKLKLI